MELILNIDFNDMVVAEAIEGVPFVGSRGGWYREEDLTGMIGRAAACGYRKIYFRVAVCGRAACPSGVKEPPDHDPAWAQTLRRYDPLDVAVRAAHDAGVECWAWLTPFDECGREPGHPGSFQSRFSAEHPEFQLASREGDDTLWGVYCFGYPEVVDYFLRHLDEVLDRGPDGVFFSNRTHSNMDLRCREYGFNEPVIQRYRERHGGDPREADAYDLQRFSRVQGEFYTDFLRRAAARIHRAGARAAAAVSWQRSGRIADRLGALDRCFYDWRTWVDEDIVDELVIGGDMATGSDPEHILPYFETEADSANPNGFRRGMDRRVPIHRWLTLHGWGWPGEAERTGPPDDSFNATTVASMLAKIALSEADGVLMHEALNIAAHNQWDAFCRFAGD